MIDPTSSDRRPFFQRSIFVTAGPGAVQALTTEIVAGPTTGFALQEFANEVDVLVVDGGMVINISGEA